MRRLLNDDCRCMGIKQVDNAPFSQMTAMCDKREECLRHTAITTQEGGPRTPYTNWYCGDQIDGFIPVETDK